ncbi:hypothetical protein AKJ16_DCAP09629 [Drosera capensis]
MTLLRDEDEFLKEDWPILISHLLLLVRYITCYPSVRITRSLSIYITSYLIIYCHHIHLLMELKDTEYVGDLIIRVSYRAASSPLRVVVRGAWTCLKEVPD